MVREIKPADWKLLRQFHKVALERFCQRVLEDLTQITSKEGASYHERYGEVFQLIGKRDKELARVFDDPSRSRAFFQLATLVGSQLLSDEEFSQFSPETQEVVEVILGIRK